MKPIPEMTDDELNEAMAVEVMGWEIEKQFCCSVYFRRYCDHINCGKIFIQTVKSWHPTSDLNQAWECAGHWLFESGEWDFGVYRRWQDDELRWVVWMTKEIGTEIDIEEENTNPARAICEALLMAVRSER